MMSLKASESDTPSKPPQLLVAGVEPQLNLMVLWRGSTVWPEFLRRCLPFL